jgi:hypothetical protein
MKLRVNNSATVGRGSAEPERAKAHSQFAARFPLPPALSIGEREKRLPALPLPDAHWNFAALTLLFPLPEGEGQGEGERTAQTCDAVLFRISHFAFRIS